MITGAPSGRGRPCSLRGVACYLPGMSAWGRGRGAPTGRKIVSDASFASWWNFRAAPISRRVAVMAITSSWYEMACVPGHASWIARRGEAAMCLLWRLDGNPGGDNDVLVSAWTATQTQSRTSFSASLGTTKDARKIGKNLFPVHRKATISPSAASKV